MSTNHSFGWRKDSLDQRDFQFVPRVHAADLPTSVNLSAFMPPVYDQGQEGSCTANAVSAVLDYMYHQKHGVFLTPSRNFQYYNTRLLEGTTKSDAGGSIRDAIKAAAQYGICPEKEYPYTAATLYKKPAAKYYTDAKKEIIAQYQAVAQSLSDMQAALAGGLPIVIGFSVYASFETETVAATGLAPLPGKKEAFEGGHAVVVVGFNNATQTFTCRNSWGTDWGLPTLHGYFELPYAYLLNPKLASDFWVIQSSN